MILELFFNIIVVTSVVHRAPCESISFRYQLSLPKRRNYKRKNKDLKSHWMLVHHVALHRAHVGTCLRLGGMRFPTCSFLCWMEHQPNLWVASFQHKKELNSIVSIFLAKSVVTQWHCLVFPTETSRFKSLSPHLNVKTFFFRRRFYEPSKTFFLM